MTLTPKRAARYRAAWGGTIDLRHYDSDTVTFVDEHGITWRRVAITERLYRDVAHAKEELDRLEAR